MPQLLLKEQNLQKSLSEDQPALTRPTRRFFLRAQEEGNGDGKQEEQPQEPKQNKESLEEEKDIQKMKDDLKKFLQSNARPSLNSLKKLADRLGLDPEDLLRPTPEEGEKSSADRLREQDPETWEDYDRRTADRLLREALGGDSHKDTPDTHPPSPDKPEDKK